MTRLKQARMASVLIALSCGPLSAGQEQQPSPTELVHSLANRPFEDSLGCSASRNMDPIVEAIVQAGSNSLTAVEAAMRSLEHAGRRSEYFESSSWVMVSYARLKGREAFPRLRRLRADPRFGSLVDRAIAVSLGLTGYVSASERPGRIIHCTSPQGPHTALSQLILAWLRGDREWLVSALAPPVATSTTALTRARADSAVGYRFRNAASPGTPAEPGATFELDTEFTTSSGANCGEARVSFVAVANRTAPGYLALQVNSQNIADLLVRIAACAAQ